MLFSLQNQIETNNLHEKIEILVHSDEMQKSLGDKCNDMIKKAKGIFVVGIGDDDEISDDYCKVLCDTIEQNPNVDQITFGVKQINKLLFSFNATYSKENKNIIMNFRFFHLMFKTFGDLSNRTHEDFDFYIFNKKICHCRQKTFTTAFITIFILLFMWCLKEIKGYSWTILPIRKEIAEQIKFSNASRSQDKEFIMKIRDLDLIKSEVVLDKVLYNYNYNPKYSLNRDFHIKNPKKIKKEKIDHEIKEITLNNIVWI